MKKDKVIENLTNSFGNWMNEKDGDLGEAKMTSELYPYNHIFSPIQINRITIKNRVVMGPMGNLNMCEESGRPNNKMLQYFFERARGGVGLLTTGLIPVSHGIDNSVTETGKLTMFPRIDRSRTVFSGWRDLAQGVHANGSKIFIQITPGLGRVGPPTCLVNEKKFPKSASFNPNFYIPEVPCLRLSDGKLKKIIKNVGQAAADAKECGLDGVYLHGHEGYLLEQMTNPAFNRRKMGRYSDYKRFGIEAVEEIRERVGKTYPIMYRIDLSLALNETYGESMAEIKSLKKFQNGRNIEETLAYMNELVKAGVDIFDVDLGCYDNWWLPHPPAGMPAGCFLDISKIAKDYFAKNNIKSNMGVEVPVVAVGKLGYPDIAEKALRDGRCDMVMLARPLLSDPEWCNKAYSGKVKSIIPCIGCQEGCINEFVEGGHPQCAVNPRTGHEDTLPKELSKAEIKKSIAVIGAGPAGIVFSLTAAKRGHKVDLYEKAPVIGGKIIAGSVPKIKFDVVNYLEHLRHEVSEAEKNYDFKLHLNTSKSSDELKDMNYDSVIFAYGTKDINPPFPGKDKMKTVQGTELLLHPELMKDAKRIVVIGGGVVGCETAYWLKYEHNKDVTVVEMLPNFMTGVCTANRGHLLYYLKKADVKLLNCTKLSSFEKNSVIVERNTNKNVPNPYNTWNPLLPTNIPNPMDKKILNEFVTEEIPADLVVLAMGGRADESLFFEAQRKLIASEVYNIGDSQRPGRVLEASRAAYRMALNI